MNAKYETKVDKTASLTHENSLRNSSITGTTTTINSQSHLDSGISMSANSTEKQEQISSWPTSFTVNNILVGNEGKSEIDALKHVAEPTTMMIRSPHANVMPTNNVLPPYSVPQQSTSRLSISYDK